MLRGREILWCAVVAGVLGFAGYLGLACAGETSAAAPESRLAKGGGGAWTVVVVPDSAEAVVGHTVEFGAAVFNPTGKLTGVSPTWSAAPDSVGSVDQEGRFAALRPGEAVVVAEAKGASDSAVVAVEDTTTASAPAMPSQLTVEVGADSTRFDAADSEGATFYRWRGGLNGGGSEWGPDTTEVSRHAIPAQADGDWWVCVEAGNDVGPSDPACDSYLVETANEPPVASFTFACTDLSCDFDASGSGDPDGTISSYDWDFGDGAVGTGQLVSHTYAVGGTYTVLLTVVDDAGAADDTAQAVSVSEPATTTVAPIETWDAEGYETTSDFHNDPALTEWNNPEKQFLDKTVAPPDGTRSIRWDFVDQGVASWTVGFGFPGPITNGLWIEEMWAEVWFRLSDNYTACHPDEEPCDHKFVFFQYAKDGDGRAEVHFTGGGQQSTKPESELKHFAGIGFQDTKRSMMVGPSLADLKDGGWHHTRMYARVSSAPGVADGVLRVWIDGVLRGEITDAVTTKDGQTFRRLLIGRNKDKGQDVGTESVWVGRAAIWDTDPGW